MKKLIMFFFFIASASYSQSYDDASEASELCLLAQGSIDDNFINDKDADIALEKILSVIGASKRFILQPCSDINNAVASSYKGLRYILYDKSFMSTIANNSTSWSQLFILAHEVGHHINGHSIDILLTLSDIVEPKTIAAKRKQELESDEFAGFILGKLGATLEQTSEAINLLASNKDDTYSTHPNKSKRLNAIKIGFNKALGKEQVVYEKKSNLNTAEEYFYRAYEKSVKGHYIGAISDYTKAIEINPNYADAYNNRGNNKDDLKDYYGAISDYTKAIEINPNNEDAYYNRGISKYYSKDYNGAISDFTKAIEINPKEADVYNNRGLVKDDLKDYYGAISDYTKAIEINPNFVLAYTGRGNTKTNLKDYNGAISDFTKAIEINPNFASAYFVRGINKYYLNDFYGACIDVKKAQGLGYDDDDVKQLINILCK